MVVLLIALQGHTLILLPPCGYTGCRTSSRYSHAGTIRILLLAVTAPSGSRERWGRGALPYLLHLHHHRRVGGGRNYTQLFLQLEERRSFTLTI